MKQSIFLFVCFFSLTAHSQLTKGNWLVGGTGSFLHDRAVFQDQNKSTGTQFEISSRTGHFLADRFALGIYGSYNWYTDKLQNTKVTTYNYGIGPFVRYYFLPDDHMANLLIEGNGAYNVLHTNNGNSEHKSSFYSYGLAAGPVIYFNSCVGVEFLLGYKGIRESENAQKNDGVHFSIGLQVHLEKDE